VVLLRPLTNTARLRCIRVCTSTDVVEARQESRPHNLPVFLVGGEIEMASLVPMQLTDGAVALAAAEAGAAVVRRHFRTEVTRHLKLGTDFATDADLEAETAIRAVLTEHRPGDAQLGEEHGASGPDSPRRWLIDPLCGTRNFAAGLPMISSNVALSVDGTIAAAASAECVGDETYWTDGEQAWVRRAGGDVALRPDPLSLMVSINLEVDAAGRRRASDLMADPAFFETFQPRITSTTLALAWVASGRHAAYLTEGDLVDNVHFAAGIGLCVAAGCVVTDLGGGPVRTHAGEASRGPGGLLAASDPQTHMALLSRYRIRSPLDREVS
jgi:myo-inositol-1(or 4)-monophosphatase